MLETPSHASPPFSFPGHPCGISPFQLSKHQAGLVVSLLGCHARADVLTHSCCCCCCWRECRPGRGSDHNHPEPQTGGRSWAGSRDHRPDSPNRVPGSSGRISFRAKVTGAPAKPGLPLPHPVFMPFCFLDKCRTGPFFLGPAVHFGPLLRPAQIFLSLFFIV